MGRARPEDEATPGGNGHQSHDSAHARADAQRDKAGGQEQSGQKQRDGERTQRHGDRGVDGTHLFRRGGKRAGEDEDPNHHHQIFLTRSAAEHTHSFGDGKQTTVEFGFRGARGIGLIGDEKGVGRGDDKDNDERHLVEIARGDPQHEEKHDHQQQRAHRQPSAPRRHAGRRRELCHKGTNRFCLWLRSYHFRRARPSTGMGGIQKAAPLFCGAALHFPSKCR